MLKISVATEKEIPVIEDILLDTAAWLDSTGKPLWTKEQATWAKLSKNFIPSDFYLAWMDGMPVGCMALLVDHDSIFWPGFEKGTSLFIHKLAVKRIAAGQGVSAALLDQAKKECIRREIPSLCLDCHAGIAKLRALYERHGFVCVEERMIHGKHPTAFYLCPVHDTEHLYHYHEKGLPPFITLTALPFHKAKEILNHMNSRLPDIDFFLTCRYDMEKTLRSAFIAPGGRPVRTAPVYMTLGPNKGMETWFHEPAILQNPLVWSGFCVIQEVRGG